MSCTEDMLQSSIHAHTILIYVYEWGMIQEITEEGTVIDTAPPYVCDISHTLEGMLPIWSKLNVNIA